MCKKLKLLIMFAILLFVVTSAYADEIRLTDGRYIEVERCWEKDGEVIFKVKDNGRLFSLKKELVEEIIGKKDNQPDRPTGK
jgi:hypothetical protein